ncbi:MAG: Asp-tRNA(Asn)/Glu-tRNA(Gln) amidotransferase GatCAB subunit A [Chloroflexi bacterium]|nr:Asp-tRNA(Asn)/Glu-tRNA(Gln) amidotransferase GatCAB subunit A [Chloroflexota bacterium]|tara:strand:- start:5351 stop:6808 length:1458 start_codon:yes stop_codon:yes gene_type:complete
MINLTDLTIDKARLLLDSKEISALELTKLYLDRIDDLDANIASFLSINYENAIKQADNADSLIAKGDSNILTGIPMQIKDNICTKGIRTTCASNMLEDFVPPYNAHIVEKLNEAGAILLGKGNLDEFAMGSSTENSSFKITKNPWDITRVPGGSSGGPAASVAASEVLFSIGSDTGGSIRQPASFCGVVGMKPTYGLVSRFGLIAFASSLDQIGPITNNVKDSAIVLSAMAGYDSRDSTSLKVDIPDYSKGLKADLKGFNIGVPKEYFTLGIDPKIENNIREAIKTLEELGANIEEVTLPHTEYALSVYYIIAPSEASANLSRYDGVKYGYSDSKSESMWDALEATRESGFGPEVKRRIFLGTYALSSGYYDAYYVKAQKVRTLIRQDFENAFKKFDVLVMPTCPTTAFNVGDKIDDPIQMYLNDIFTIPANIAGIPGISVPSGLIDGLPVGLQFMSGSLQEKKLFQAAYAYERATDWNNLKPNI